MTDPDDQHLRTRPPYWEGWELISAATGIVIAVAILAFCVRLWWKR